MISILSWVIVKLFPIAPLVAINRPNVSIRVRPIKTELSDADSSVTDRTGGARSEIDKLSGQKIRANRLEYLRLPTLWGTLYKMT